MEESEILIDVAVFGEQVDQFCKSDIGKYLLARCQQEVKTGISALKSADCNNPQEVWNAQAQIKIGESIEDWLKEAILSGLKAKQVLEDRE